MVKRKLSGEKRKRIRKFLRVGFRPVWRRRKGKARANLRVGTKIKQELPRVLPYFLSSRGV